MPDINGVWRNISIYKGIKGVYGDMVCNCRPFNAHYGAMLVWTGTSYLDDSDFFIPINDDQHHPMNKRFFKSITPLTKSIRLVCEFEVRLALPYDIGWYLLYWSLDRYKNAH
jgi:hypothetical protein